MTATNNISATTVNYLVLEESQVNSCQAFNLTSVAVRRKTKARAAQSLQASLQSAWGTLGSPEHVQPRKTAKVCRMSRLKAIAFVPHVRASCLLGLMERWGDKEKIVCFIF